MSVLQKKPEVVVFAGPNGSGKSTITELLKPQWIILMLMRLRKVSNALIWMRHRLQKSNGKSILSRWTSFGREEAVRVAQFRTYVMLLVCTYAGMR